MATDEQERDGQGNADSAPAPEEGRIGPEHPLADVIARAYRVFDRPIPASDHACACCMCPEIKRDFLNHTARTLPFDHCAAWSMAAIDPDLPQEFWGWLLPRILEIIASGDEMNWASYGYVLSRYPTGDKSRWSPDEWSVLDDFQRQYMLNFPYMEWDFLDDALCMFARAGWPVADLFAQIDQWPTDRLVAQLADDWHVPNFDAIIIAPEWEDAKIPWRFWTRRALFERLFLYGMNPATPRPLAEKALHVAACIDHESQWDAPLSDDARH